MASDPIEKMQEIIRQLPDDSTYEDILRELAFGLMVERGLEDSLLLHIAFSSCWMALTHPLI